MTRFGKQSSEDAGRLGEHLAARLLESEGYEILRSNCRGRFGEIDLIARDGDEVVFVEVKTRGTDSWGDPSEAVHPEKQKRLRRSAEDFAARNKLDELTLRFDVVAVILPEPPAVEPVLRHYKDAFGL